MHNHRAALPRDDGLQLECPKSVFLTFQILVHKLQNLTSTTEAGLLKFCVRYCWVKATSECGWSSIQQMVIDQTIDQWQFRLKKIS